VTPERLANPDKEPQNWLMNHRSYDSQRYSPLDKINTGNVKSLKLAYAVALGGTGSTRTWKHPTGRGRLPLRRRSMGILYKIDARSGDAGRIVWRMDPKQERRRTRTAAQRSGAISSSRRELPAARDRGPTRRTARSPGRPIGDGQGA
jgi:alcohol dehydrogenase (cytochrome c)